MAKHDVYLGDVGSGGEVDLLGRDGGLAAVELAETDHGADGIGRVLVDEGEVACVECQTKRGDR